MLFHEYPVVTDTIFVNLERQYKFISCVVLLGIRSIRSCTVNLPGVLKVTSKRNIAIKFCFTPGALIVEHCYYPIGIRIPY